MSDDGIIRRAFADDRVLITTDKDFGEHVFRDNKSSEAVVLLRIGHERTDVKIRELGNVIDGYSYRLPSGSTVATETAARIVRGPRS